MATQSVELFLRAMDAINRGDAEGLVALCDPEGVVEARRSSVEGPYRGHDGVRRFIADNAESFETFRVSYPDVRELDDGRLLAIGTIRIRGRGSNIETDVPTAGIATFRDGLFFHWKEHGDAEHALEAAGL